VRGGLIGLRCVVSERESRLGRTAVRPYIRGVASGRRVEGISHSEGSERTEVLPYVLL